jgi:hypothetical protein
MTTEWQIRTLHPAPAMTEQVTKFRGTYADACNAARESYRNTGRRSAVVSGMTYWFRVSAAGEVDRNAR